MQIPTGKDRRFFKVRQCLTANGDYGDLIVEQGAVQDDGDLHTDLHVLPFYLSVEQALSEVNDRYGK